MKGKIFLENGSYYPQEINIETLEWKNKGYEKRGFVWHLDRHVINGDDIEKQTFLKCSNDLNKNGEQLKIDDINKYNSKRLSDCYRKLSIETVYSSMRFYMSKDNGASGIIFPGTKKCYEYTTITNANYKPCILTSYPAHISNMFWLVPSLAKNFKNIEVVESIRIENIANKRGIEDWLNDVITSCIENAYIPLKDEYLPPKVKHVKSENAIKGALMYYFTKMCKISGLDSLYKELVNKDENKDIFDKPRKYLATKEIKSLKNIGFNLYLYEDKIELLYLLEKDKELFREDLPNKVKLSTIDHSMLSLIENNKSKEVEVEMVLISEWLNSMIKKFDDHFFQLLNESYSGEDNIIDFVIINWIFSMYKGLYVFKRLIDYTGIPADNTYYKDYLEDYRTYCKELLKTIDTNEALNKWYKGYKAVFEIDLQNI